MQLADIAKAMKCYQSSKGNICEGIIATKDRRIERDVHISTYTKSFPIYNTSITFPICCTQSSA